MNTVTAAPQPACEKYPHLFAAEALTYQRNDPEYRELTPHGHAEMGILRERMENACKYVCMGCPLLFQCEEQVLANDVYGVAAAMTAEERHERNPNLTAPIVELNDRDRDSRGRVNAEALYRYLGQGLTNETIANRLGCSTRTVARARTTPCPTTTHEHAVTATSPKPSTQQGGTITPVTRFPAKQGRRSAAMTHILSILADGQWHHRADLIESAIPYVSDTDAIAKFHRISTKPAPYEEQIERGAHAFIANALSASARTWRGVTRRDPNNRDMYQIAELPEMAVRNVA